MANTQSFSLSYTQKTVKMPTFDFFIPKDNFFINAHGVSVTDITKSSTELSNGEISILNRSNNLIYFNSLLVSSITVKKDTKTPRILFRVNKTKTLTTGNYILDEYTIRFRNRSIGLFLLKREANFYDGSNTVLYPFQSTKIQAAYIVLNPSQIGIQYFGKSNTNPDRLIGTLDINLTVNMLNNLSGDIIISEPITISINLINTGFKPQSGINQSIDYNVGDGFINIDVLDTSTTADGQSITLRT